MDTFSQHLAGVHNEYILDKVLDNIEELMLNHIPPSNASPNTLGNCSMDSSSSSSCTPKSSSLNMMDYPPVYSMNSNSSMVSIFCGENEDKIELKDNIFINKDCSYRLSQYISKENWGKDCILLYKYLDYIFRCQLFNKQIVKISQFNTPKYLIFHSGLQRRYDNQFLFVLSTPNFISKPQKWRAQIGNVYNSFLSRAELLQKLKESNISINEQYLPQRTVFAQSMHDSIYNPTYSIKVNWEERLKTITDRIYTIMGPKAFYDGKDRKHLKLAELIESFEDGLSNTKIMSAINPNIAVPQGFVDTKRQKYRMELLLPLCIKFKQKKYTFALALAPNNRKRECYDVKSVLTLNMGYSNARLVGYVNSEWLVRSH